MNLCLFDPKIRLFFYSHLAQALDYPDSDLVESLASGSFSGALGEALEVIGFSHLNEALKGLVGEYIESGRTNQELLLELERDYTWMCFASKPPLVRLFESVYNEGKLLQESTFQLARLYYQAGLKLDEDFGLPPDHIAVEFEFMAYLCINEIKSKREGDTEKENYARKLQKEVLENHLGPFAVNFAEALGQNSKTSFYKIIAAIIAEIFGSS